MTKWKVVEAQEYVFEHESSDPADALGRFRLFRDTMAVHKSGGPKFTVVEVREKEATE